MHRSGTSAAAGALRLLGARLGDRLVPAADDNAKGYWEDADVVDLHERLLEGLSRSWDDVRALPSQWGSAECTRQARGHIRRVVAGFAGDALWAVKDPRMARFVPLWLEEIGRARQRAACLLVVRHPDEVAASLRARNGLPSLVGHLLWLRHVLESVRDSAGAPRVMIRYEQLLGSPTECLQRVGAHLGLTWPVSIEQARSALERFVDSAERHQAAASGMPATTGPLGQLVHDVYAHCLAVSQDEGQWAGFAPLLDAGAAALDAAATWTDAIGEVQAADAMALRRYDATHRMRMEAVEGAKRDAEQMAIDRLRELQRTTTELEETRRLALDREKELSALGAALSEAQQLALQRLADTQTIAKALSAAETLAVARREELEELSRAHRATQELAVSRLNEVERLAVALDDSNALALERQAQLETLTAAHHDAERLARQRLGELEQLSAAHQDAERLARQRLGELEQLSAAHQDAERLARQRLGELHQLSAAHDQAAELALKRLSEVRELSLALDASNALALARQDELEAWAKAKEDIEQLALARLTQIEALSESLARSQELARKQEIELEQTRGELASAKQAMADQYALIERLESEVLALRTELIALRSTLSWKVAAPVRAVESWNRRRAARDA
ncbi:hypothetical protein [Cognatilysobacter tabacisoli]|uniref:hypothetical protein n=1 Tax=Cognatilysobacter tabacisoli TaxID=2315424 RepID=UPI0013005347|nr:hypothetical protein [Lysobacter tabacisoli]